MGKLKKLVDDFCVKHQIFYKQEIMQLYVEKHSLALLLKGIEIRVQKIETAMGCHILYVPYIVEYWGGIEKPWWDSNTYNIHTRLSETRALYLLIKRIQEEN